MIKNGVAIGNITFREVVDELARLGIQGGSEEGIALVKSLGLEADWLRPKQESSELGKLADTSAGINDGIPPRYL